jgi:hypothetical protein
LCHTLHDDSRPQASVNADQQVPDGGGSMVIVVELR